MTSLRIGIVAAQGAFVEHIRSLQLVAESMPGVHLRVEEVRHAEQLIGDGQDGGLDGLVIPGGESTSMARVLAAQQFTDVYDQWRDHCQASGKKGIVMGTCAGLIILSDVVLREKVKGQWHLGGLSILCERNANGRQCESHEKIVYINNGEKDRLEYRGIFIRSPRIVELLRPTEVEVLATTHDGEPVAVRQGHIIALTFHPELTDDLYWHRLFLQTLL